MDKTEGFKEVALLTFVFLMFSLVTAFGATELKTSTAATEAGLMSVSTQDPMLEQQSDIDFNLLIDESLHSQNELNQKILQQTKAVQEAFDFEKKYRHPTQSDRIRRTAQYKVDEFKVQNDVEIILIKTR